MAKAQITLPDGTSVRLEGTPDEIAAVLARTKKNSPKTRASPKRTTARAQPGDLVGSLIDGGFFKKPRDLASVKVALEEMGHRYPLTTLSVVMIRQVRKRNLRRSKKDKRWMYTS